MPNIAYRLADTLTRQHHHDYAAALEAAAALRDTPELPPEHRAIWRAVASLLADRLLTTLI